MFYVTADFDGIQRVEQAESSDAAMALVEEFQLLGATTISVTDRLGSYAVAELQEMLNARMHDRPRGLRPN